MTRAEYGGAPRLDALLARAAATAPDREAVVFGGLRLTYAQVQDRVRRLAGGLRQRGVSPGDRVALWAPNRPEFMELFFGVPRAGAVFAPLDCWWNWTDAHAALEQIRPRVLVLGPAQTAAAAGSLAALRAVGVEQVVSLDGPWGGPAPGSYHDLVARADPLDAPVPVEPASAALILFTSGSTGRSKGAVHSHGGLVTTAMTMSVEVPFTDGERTLHFLPLFSSCLEHLLPLTLLRATHVILPRFDPEAVWQTVRDERISHFDAVPTTLRRLLDALPEGIPSSLRLITYASERMPDELIRALIERLPDVSFVQFYGMIEQLCLTVLEAPDQLRKIGTVGRPMLGAELRLVDGAGEPPAPGMAGEILARGPTLFAGYWNDPQATANVVEGRWFRTGDLGRFDQDGFLVLEGRIKELIKTGGLTVIPAEIEAILASHPAVREAAVIGVPDPEWGESVQAFVTLIPNGSVSEGELEAFCRERLTGYKRPKVIHLVTDLPRTGIGKIARRVVRDRVMASGQAGE